MPDETTATFEILARFRDEATQGLATLKSSAESAGQGLAVVGRTGEISTGHVRGMLREVKGLSIGLLGELNPALANTVGGLTQATRFALDFKSALGFAVAGVGIAVVAATQYITTIKAAAKEQADFNLAVKTFDVGALQSKIKQAQTEIEDFRLQQQSVGTIITTYWSDVWDSIVGKKGREQRLREASEALTQVFAVFAGPRKILGVLAALAEAQKATQAWELSIAATDETARRAYTEELRLLDLIAKARAADIEKERDEAKAKATTEIEKATADAEAAFKKQSLAEQTALAAKQLKESLEGRRAEISLGSDLIRQYEFEVKAYEGITEVVTKDTAERMKGLSFRELENAEIAKTIALFEGEEKGSEGLTEALNRAPDPAHRLAALGREVDLRKANLDLLGAMIDAQEKQGGLTTTDALTARIVQQQAAIQGIREEIAKLVALRDELNNHSDAWQAINQQIELLGINAKKAGLTLQSDIIAVAQRTDVFEGLKRGFADVADAAGSWGTRMRNLVTTTSGTMADTMTELFFARIEGRFDDLTKIAQDAGRNMLRAFVGEINREIVSSTFQLVKRSLFGDDRAPGRAFAVGGAAGALPAGMSLDQMMKFLTGGGNAAAAPAVQAALARSGVDLSTVLSGAINVSGASAATIDSLQSAGYQIVTAGAESLAVPAQNFLTSAASTSTGLLTGLSTEISTFLASPLLRATYDAAGNLVAGLTVGQALTGFGGALGLGFTVYSALTQPPTVMGSLFNAASGALSGALLGSAIAPGPGTVIGAIAGALIGGGATAFGKPAEKTHAQREAEEAARAIAVAGPMIAEIDATTTIEALHAVLTKYNSGYVGGTSSIAVVTQIPGAVGVGPGSGAADAPFVGKPNAVYRVVTPTELYTATRVLVGIQAGVTPSLLTTANQGIQAAILNKIQEIVQNELKASTTALEAALNTATTAGDLAAIFNRPWGNAIVLQANGRNYTQGAFSGTEFEVPQAFALLPTLRVLVSGVEQAAASDELKARVSRIISRAFTAGIAAAASLPALQGLQSPALPESQQQEIQRALTTRLGLEAHVPVAVEAEVEAGVVRRTVLPGSILDTGQQAQVAGQQILTLRLDQIKVIFEDDNFAETLLNRLLDIARDRRISFVGPRAVLAF